MIRRSFLKHLAALPFLATDAPLTAGATTAKLKILLKSAWGRTTRRKPHFHFFTATRFLKQATKFRSFLLGEAVSLTRKSVANAVVPIGWPPLSEALRKIVAKKIPIYACGACSRARGITEADLNEYSAKFGIQKFLSRSSNGRIKS